MAGHIPTTRTMRYEVTNSSEAGTETSHFVDLARDLSAMNRRLYRAGMVYHVKKITVVSRNTPNGGNFVSVSAAPNTWVAHAAWKRGKTMWEKMGREAGMTSSMKATWRDFKVYLSDDHRTAGNETPKDNGGNNVGISEWNYTTFVTPDGTSTSDQFLAHLLGPDNGSAGSRLSVGLIKSYASTRPRVMQTPQIDTAAASDDPLLNLFDDGTQNDEVIEQQLDENDLPPYGVDVYHGGGSNHPKPQVQQHGCLKDGSLVLSGIEAPLGLLEFETVSPIPSDTYSILVEVALGPYKGVKAYPMGE